MSCDQKLRLSSLDTIMDQSQKRELPLRRKRRLRLVQQKQSLLYSILKNGEKCFAMRSRMQRTPAVAAIRVSAKFWIDPTRIQERSEMSLKLCPKKIAISRLPAKRWPQDFRK